MLQKDLLLTAYRGVTVNKSRSLLTTLGIIIGVGSVVLMVSIGRSFQNYIITQVESVGTNTVEVFPTGLEKFGGNLDGLTIDDFEVIERLPGVSSATPVIIMPGATTYGREDASPLVFGAYSIMTDNYGLKLAEGRLLEQNDEDGAKSVAVLGNKVVEDLFGDANPIGKRVSIGNNPITVVGVLQPMGGILADLDNTVFIPFSTARALTGQRYLSYMVMKAEGDQELLVDEITQIMRIRHNIDNPENDPDLDDFRVRGAEQFTQILNSVTLGLTIFLSLVAGISLLVGGIGIMNIMLVSVTERTREIGLRKAVGARSADILRQFLLESVALTLTGGIIGIIGGVTIGWLLSQLAASALGSFQYIVSVWAILAAVIMAVGTGLLFGIYPAKRAAALSPMEALRYE